MNLQSKQLSELSEEKPSLYDRIEGWVEDHNPFPYHIRYWFNDKDIFHPTRIYRKCSNIVRWLPLLWNDADWDYCYLYEIMAFKIKNMREHQRDHHNHTDFKEVMEQMQKAEDCLQRIREDNYIEKEYEAHRKKWPSKGTIPVPGKPGWTQMVPMEKKASVEFRKLIALEEKRRQDDYDTFTSIFTKYSRSWWD